MKKKKKQKKKRELFRAKAAKTEEGLAMAKVRRQNEGKKKALCYRHRHV
jgi:hypothetical protein